MLLWFYTNVHFSFSLNIRFRKHNSVMLTKITRIFSVVNNVMKVDCCCHEKQQQLSVDFFPMICCHVTLSTNICHLFRCSIKLVNTCLANENKEQFWFCWWRSSRVSSSLWLLSQVFFIIFILVHLPWWSCHDVVWVRCHEEIIWELRIFYLRITYF